MTRRHPIGALVLALISALAFAALPSAASATKQPTPMIFVHGGSGSAQQFETNAMRFDSNGFPHKRIFVYEYDTSGSSNDLAISNLDGFIADVKDETGAKQVDVLAHSRGTTIMHAYLATPERAASVRRYVNFDGRGAETEPGGVPTLAIWGEGDQTRAIGGARNSYFPDRAHTEVTTSRAAFKPVYKFLVGRAPKTGNVVPQKPSKVRVAGRAVSFPSNFGAEGGTLAVYEVKASTGIRKSGKPIYETTLGADGTFGPVQVNGTKRYEFALTREGRPVIHNYPQPFERSDYFYRVLDAPVLSPFIDSGPDQSVVTVTRMREFWGDQADPAANDRLRVNGVDVINPATAPRSRRVLAVFNFDKGADGVTDTSASLPPFNVIPFLTAVDLFMQSSPDASGTIPVVQTVRTQGYEVTTNVPNWPSLDQTNAVSVFFKDYKPLKYKHRHKH
jgi:pimeloyl-ACP methyl ester carboxylesterase